MKSKDNKIDYWMTVYTVMLVIIFPQIGKLLFPHQQSVLFAGIYGAIGGALGAAIYFLVKNRIIVIKIMTLVVIIVLSFGSFAFLVKMNSDQEIVKRNWERQSIEKVSFQFPTKFIEIELDKNELASIRVFQDASESRLSMYLVYDFFQTPPTMDESLSGSIINALSKLGGENFEWFDTQISDASISTRYKYTIADNEYIGYGFIYNKEKHFESLILMPYTKNYSDEFLDKVINSISIENKKS